ncbi:MAG: aspartate/glutamate racemase family protein [Candidatus Aminicenantes bacterium]|nr:aspartate/glutamate racemase family protein [Candidatus Aminicenantes bacterium]
MEKNYSDFFHLLLADETDLPDGVKKTIGFFIDNKLWFNLSRNVKALGCREAANKRNRLGHTGIPLEHELKSIFGKFINAAGNEQYVILHCKAHQELDYDKVKKVLRARREVNKLENDELADIFHMDYGLVNPFTLDPLFWETPILQVFDKSLTINNLPPYTMMTNAGDLTWAIEFKPKELFEAVKHYRIEDITTHISSNNRSANKKRPKIGILTGNAPESGIALWQKINHIIREERKEHFYGDISFPYVTVESIPDMGLSMELDLREKETWEAVNAGIISLCNQGATIVCIACDTTQYFTPRIREITSQYKSRFISIPEVTFDYLAKNKINEFAFLGIKYVTDLSDKWSAFKKLRKFKIETLSEESIKKIHELAFKVKREGITGPGITKLRDLLNHETKSKTIVVALTELSILLGTQKKRSRKGRTFIDTLDLLADAVAGEYLRLTQNLYPDTRVSQ